MTDTVVKAHAVHLRAENIDKWDILILHGQCGRKHELHLLFLNLLGVIRIAMEKIIRILNVVVKRKTL